MAFETDSTKYREYFRGIAEGTNSRVFLWRLVGYYVHVHLYDGIFEGVSVLQPLKVGDGIVLYFLLHP